MNRLSAYLAEMNAYGLFSDDVLRDLSYWKIKYLEDSAQLLAGGVLVPAPRFTMRQMMNLAESDNWTPVFSDEAHGFAFLTVGYRTVASIVALLLPLIPIPTQRDPVTRYDLDIENLIRYGF